MFIHIDDLLICVRAHFSIEINIIIRQNYVNSCLSIQHTVVRHPKRDVQFQVKRDMGR